MKSFKRCPGRPIQRTVLLAIALTGAMTLAACGSGESDTDTDGSSDATDESSAPADLTRRGRFLDSAVAGLSWTSESGSGTTDTDGMFFYREGESLTFSIGDIVLPPVPGASLITALDVFDSLDTNTRRVVNLNRLLQSLDADAKPENGIVIDSAAAFAATGLTVDFASPGFDSDVINLVANAGSTSSGLVTAQAATTHFLATLDANDISTSDCGDTHPAVGRTATLIGSAHAVSGSLTVLDDCTLEVGNFTYDGGGPDVAFYAGRRDDYGPDAVRLSPALDGRVYDGDTVRLTLPEGTTLDDVNNLSVWCFDVQVSFGDAFFGASQ